MSPAVYEAYCFTGISQTAGGNYLPQSQKVLRLYLSGHETLMRCHQDSRPNNALVQSRVGKNGLLQSGKFANHIPGFAGW
jgi:hypothetical protein